MSKLLAELLKLLGARGFLRRYVSIARSRIFVSLSHPRAEYFCVGIENSRDAYATWVDVGGKFHYMQCPRFNKASRKARFLLNAINS